MISIDPIEHEDLAELGLLYEELIGSPSDVKKMQELFANLKDNVNYRITGIKVDGVLAGSVMGIICQDLVGDCRPFMVIENVVISLKFRGLGLGKKIMNEMENIAKRAECYYIIFVSSSYRKDAHRFYESLGYKLDEVQGFRKMI
ncbi:GNAT family N-acetyltransferase [Paenibacillus glacialis]|uniref:GNAT family N-acetyltransferase n=1 Tax=Paenibacillus glacialis TaxID=494026 RepID=A0A162K6L5_9BACL|nr:GNAT family N-acetyltransferase [Paenibacillus glacialis]OAB43766.1 GNAT family N-acetyltransferase [Paenibacillus glacialis]